MIKQSDVLPQFEGHDHLQRLADHGIITSIVFGPIGGGASGYSVTCCASSTGSEFEMPFQGNDLAHCAWIAEVEAIKRGWVPPRNTSPNAETGSQ